VVCIDGWLDWMLVVSAYRCSSEI